MKTILILLIAIVSFGCNSTPKQTAYRSLSTIATGVNVAKHVYEDYRDSGKNVTREQDNKVKELYAKYQAAMKVAEQTYKSSETISNDASITTIANELIIFIQTINVSFNLKTI